MKKEINPEEFMRNSELISQLRESCGEEAAKHCQQLLELTPLEQVFAVLAIGIHVITGEEVDSSNVALIVNLLDVSLFEPQKKLLLVALKEYLDPIFEHLKKYQERN